LKRLSEKGIPAVFFVATMFLMMSFTPNAYAFGGESISVILDGRWLTFDRPPVMESGRVLVPLRAIFEALGAGVQYLPETAEIIAVKPDTLTVIQLRVGQSVAYKNGVAVSLDVPARVIDGRSLVPLRFVSEALGASVSWDEITSTVSITSPAALPGTLAVVVDDHPAVRPQSGLSKADIIYEVGVAPGITRLLALYHKQSAEKIGPVRSLRLQLLNIARSYDAPVAHAGGEADVLRMIRDDRTIKSLDEIYGYGPYFWRDPNGKAPHNLYTSTTNLLRAGFAPGRPPSLPLGRMEGGQNASSVAIEFPTYYGPPEKREFKWDVSVGRYLRHTHFPQGDWNPLGLPASKAMGGHFSDGIQLWAANVIVMKAPYRARIDEDGYWSWVADLVGEGDAEFYRDGEVWFGKWSKLSPDAEFNFMVGGRVSPYTAPMLFAPGPTWIEVVPSEPLVYYTGKPQEATEQALTLLKEKAPEYYRFVGSWAGTVALEDLSKGVVGVLGRKGVAAVVRPNYNMIVLDSKYVQDFASYPVDLAGTLVHEATHIMQSHQGRYAGALAGEVASNLPYLIVDFPLTLIAPPLGLTAGAMVRGGANLAEIEACDEQREALKLLNAPQWILDNVQRYRLDNETLLADLTQKFVEWIGSGNRGELARQSAQRVLEKYGYEIMNLVPGVVRSGLTKVGDTTYAIEIDIRGQAVLPHSVEGVPVIVNRI